MQRIQVWDIGVRLFHWVLVAAVTTSAVTGFILGDTDLAWHLLAGEAVLLAVGWRVIWGWLGRGPARFTAFAFPPASVARYAADLLNHRARRHLGHNPLGAMMVFAFLAMLAALIITGALTLGGLLKQGPLKAWLSYATGQSTLRVHNLLAILLLVMIGLHLAGVAFESWRERENLVGAMVTGEKRASQRASAGAKLANAPSRRLPALGIAIALVAAGGLAIARLASLPGKGVPPATLDPIFAEQCGACHLPFPPSLAPASTWAAITADLPHHFGADASLSPDQAAHISAWLAANSAEHWDTLPSHVLRTPAPGSRRITDTPGWQRRHRAISAATFASAPIYRRSDCAACHADADTGGFAPQDIQIPQPR
jgi:cytochrome b